VPDRLPALPPVAVDAAIAVVCFLATITLPLKAARTQWWLYALAALAALPGSWERRRTRRTVKRAEPRGRHTARRRQRR